jgi:hypothetical protein
MTRTRLVSTFLIVSCGVALASLPQCNGDDGMAAQEAARTAVPPGERLRLLVSGSMHSRLEPCGCAKGQSGGLGRRMAFVQESPAYDLLIEGGDLVAGGTPLDKEKAFTAVQILFGMKKAYDVLAVGPRDLELPLAEWSAFLASWMTAGNAGERRHALLASDLRSTGGEWPAQAFLEREIRGVKARVASLTMQLPAALRQAEPAPFELLPPAAAWQRAMLGAGAETRRIVLVHAEPPRVREIAAALEPPPDLVVGVDDSYHEPPPSAEHVRGIPVVFPGIRGRILLDLTLARDAEGRPQLTGYQPIELKGSETKRDAGQDPDVKLILLQHRQFVKEEKVLEAMADRSPPADGRKYVGSAACKDCHLEEYEIWQRSKHGRAWKTLVDAENDGGAKYGWPVTHYPDCVSCHVVGYGRPGGFVSGDATPELVDVGCERCHGPGSEHAATSGTSKLGKVGGGTPSIVCTQCHDFEQTPDFDYNQRWQMIRHGPQK